LGACVPHLQLRGVRADADGVAQELAHALRQLTQVVVRRRQRGGGGGEQMRRAHRRLGVRRFVGHEYMHRRQRLWADGSLLLLFGSIGGDGDVTGGSGRTRLVCWLCSVGGRGRGCGGRSGVGCIVVECWFFPRGIRGRLEVVCRGGGLLFFCLFLLLLVDRLL
jgi:hypothetical protein